MKPSHTPAHTQPPSTTTTTLEPLVQTLLQKYQNTETLHPLLQKLFESPAQKTLFTSVTQHSYNTLSSRSQKLADHEINAYEKAFCILMEEEGDWIGGLEIYVEKILGVERVSERRQMEGEEWIVKGVAVRALLERGKFLSQLAQIEDLVSSKDSPMLC